MSEIENLSAEPRAGAGKGAARSVRRQGRVPGVVYGGKQPATLISLDYSRLIREINRGGFMHRVFDLAVDGQTIRVVPRDLQLDPVKDTPLHIDFLRIVAGASIEVELPVVFVNENASPGLKRGGVLNIVRHDISVRAPADAIPDAITVDLAGLDINDSIHISSVALPEGVTPAITDRDFTIATIAAPTVQTGEAGADTPTPETQYERGGDEE
jgi:large subunit ribosomal protein L25